MRLNNPSPAKQPSTHPPPQDTIVANPQYGETRIVHLSIFLDPTRQNVDPTRPAARAPPHPTRGTTLVETRHLYELCNVIYVM